MEKLVILDIHGVLISERIFGNVPSTLDKDLIIAYPDKKSYSVKRHDLQSFLIKLFSEYRVAFYTSMTERNAMNILKLILSKKQLRNTVFIWCRDKTNVDPDEPNTFKTIKTLDSVWDAYPQFNSINTIICDDSYNKTRFNSTNNVIIVDELNIGKGIGDIYDNVLTTLLDTISDKFSKLV